MRATAYRAVLASKDHRNNMLTTIIVGKKAKINPESEMVWTDAFMRFRPLGVAKAPTDSEESYLV